MHRNTPRAIVALTLAAMAASCGGADTTGPVEDKNNGGIGNQTLLVQAEVDLEPRTGGFFADFVVSVRDGSNDPVSGADVTIVWNRSSVTLQESGTAGVYTAAVSGAASGDLKLDVVKDNMYVHDVTLGNIGIHAILEPQPNTTIPANQPLNVRWVSDREAPTASLFSPDYDFDVADTGEYVVPGDENVPRSSSWIELERYNEVTITGGLSGSYFFMEVEYRVEGLTIDGI